ncbi:MAG: lytic transglycosylase domain-containing protein [Cyclobacteriaceae bacterium]|nr:lytic transglycosylase domain-containing protein [Cytophagales bacterium]MBX2900948.1 lytic transglycosylase domain-containing protein [Cyclobacteriaceae bacterium]
MQRFINFLAPLSIGLLLVYVLFDQSTRVEEPPAVASPELEPIPVSENFQPFVAVSYDLPQSISFAGEAVPLQQPDVRERLDRELQVNIYLQSSTLFMLKRANRWLPRMTEILKAHNIPDDFKYLPLIESGLVNGVSPKEAVGYWQIREAAGKELGMEITNEVDERYDPLKSTEAACKYLKNAYTKLGSWTLAAASYNRGVAGIKSDLQDQQVDDYYDAHLNDETARYVFRILAIKEIFEHPDKYGFKLKAEHLYQPEELKLVTVTETLPSLVTFAKSQGSNYKILKRHNPWLRQPKLTVKKGKVYHIALPV